ncbi:MAG: DUF4013 domain-containing protein [Acidobacteriota bacterium]|nr:DUF4013 domain-containing protein [Acidobacteriota bacterium]
MSDAQYIPPPPPPTAPPPPAPPPVSGAPQFDFGKPFTYVFDDPQWLQKILIGGLFYLASFLIIGWFFILGYVARVVRNVIADVKLPLPEWDDLGGFFNEGVRLVGISLIYSVPILFLLAIMIPASILGDADNAAAQVVGAVAGCVACLFVPLMIVTMIFLPAALLFAVVEQRFGAAFEFARIWAFVRNNIGNYLLAIVIHIIAQHLGGFGVALLCIGVIFTGFWSFLITAHAFAQVYRLAEGKGPQPAFGQ